MELQYKKLTKSELEIAEMIFNEMTESEIAKATGRSYHTVHVHSRNLRKKIEAKSIVGVALWYAWNHVLTESERTEFKNKYQES